MVNDPSNLNGKWGSKVKRRKSKSSQGASIATLARPYAAAALAELVRIMTRSRSDSARVAASNALLDRGFGKPPPSQKIATTDIVRPRRLRADASVEDFAAEYRRMRQMLPYDGGQE